MTGIGCGVWRGASGGGEAFFVEGIDGHVVRVGALTRLFVGGE